MTDSENNDIEFEIDLGSLEESASDDVEIDLGDLTDDEADADAPVLLAEEEPEADESAAEQDDAVETALAELRAELAHCILTRKERRESQRRLEELFAEAERRSREAEGA